MAFHMLLQTALYVSVGTSSYLVCTSALQISAKKGTGVDDLLEQLLLVAEVGPNPYYILGAYLSVCFLTNI